MNNYKKIITEFIPKTYNVKNHLVYHIQNVRVNLKVKKKISRNNYNCSEK